MFNKFTAHVRMMILGIVVLVTACSAEDTSSTTGRDDTVQIDNAQLSLSKGDPSKACANRGPDTISYKLGTCAADSLASFNYNWYGSDGGNGLFAEFGDNPFVAPNSSYVQDVSFACEPMVLAMIGIGPVTIASDRRFTFWELTETEFRAVLAEHGGPQPPQESLPTYPYMQMLLDLWNCQDGTVYNAGNCPVPRPSTAFLFTKLGETKALTVSPDACDLKLIVAQRK